MIARASPELLLAVLVHGLAVRLRSIAILAVAIAGLGGTFFYVVEGRGGMPRAATGGFLLVAFVLGAILAGERKV